MSGGATASFAYDGDGNRVKGTVNGVTIAYPSTSLRASVGNYYEYNVSTGVATSYYYAGSTRVAMRQQQAGVPDVVYYLHADHLGSASLVTCGSGCGTVGGKVSDERYYPYGETRSGSSPTDRQFTGQRNEASLGSLYDYGARFYSSSLGRFLSAGTLVPSPGNPQSLNRYSYTLNDPLKYVDPTGHAQVCDDGTCGIPGTWTPPPPPWYTPIVVGAASAWGWYDENVNGTLSYLGINRFLKEGAVDFSLYGDPLSPEGTEANLITPWADMDINFQFSARLEAGNTAATARFDQTRLTGKSGNIELQADWKTGQGIVVLKTPQVGPLFLGEGTLSAKGKSVTAVGPLPPLDYGIAQTTIAEGIIQTRQLKVELDPAIRIREAYHGGPTALTVGVAGVVWGAEALPPAIVPIVEALRQFGQGYYPSPYPLPAN